MMLIDTEDRTIVDGETGGIISTAHPAGDYKGMTIECTSAALQEPLDKKCTIGSETTAPLLLRFDSPYGSKHDSLVEVTIAYSHLTTCPKVMYGCEQWNMTNSVLAADKVHEWAVWAQEKFGGAEQAWNALADRYAFRPQEADGETPDREVPLFAWPSVWREWESDHSHGYLAFHFFDTDHDLRVSREEFTFAYATALRAPPPTKPPEEPPTTAPTTTRLTTVATTSLTTVATTTGREVPVIVPGWGDATASTTVPTTATASTMAPTTATASTAAATTAAAGAVEVLGELKLSVPSVAPYITPGQTQMVLAKDWADALAEQCHLGMAAVAVHFSAAASGAFGTARRLQGGQQGLLVMYRIANAIGKTPAQLISSIQAIQPVSLMQSVAKAVDASGLPQDVRAAAESAKVVSIGAPRLAAPPTGSSAASPSAGTATVVGKDSGPLSALGGIDFTQWLPWAVAGVGLALWCLCSACICFFFRRSGSKHAAADYREPRYREIGDMERGGRSLKVAGGEGGGYHAGAESGGYAYHAGVESSGYHSDGGNRADFGGREREEVGERGPHSQTFDKLMSNDYVRRAIEEHPASWRFHHNRVLGYRDRLDDGFRALFENELLLVDSRKDRDGRSRDPVLRGYISFFQTCLPQGGGYGGMSRVAVAAKSVATIFGGGLHEFHDIHQLEANWQHRFRECGLAFPQDLPIGMFMGRRGTQATAYVSATPGRRGAGLPRHRAVLFKYVCDALTVCDSAIVWDARRSTVIVVAIVEGAAVVVDLLDEPGTMTDAADLDQLIRHASESAS